MSRIEGIRVQSKYAEYLDPFKHLCIIIKAMKTTSPDRRVYNWEPAALIVRFPEKPPVMFVYEYMLHSVKSALYHLF